MSRQSRRSIPITVQVDVLFRDGWLCSLCHRPTIFAPAMRLAGEFVRGQGYGHPLAYHHPRWRRDAAPLLDHLGCVIDHEVAFSRGGSHAPGNFAVACNKCNVYKSAAEKSKYLAEHPLRSVKGKYGEPTNWDGLSSLFVVLGRQNPSSLSASELTWLRALEDHSRNAKPSLASSPADEQLG
jgi:hypothetical protein